MSVDRASQDVSREVRRRGALILALFALIWAAAGSSGIENAAARMGVLGAALVVTVIAAWFALAGPAPDAERQRRLLENWNRRYNLIGLAQAVAIGLAIAVLVATGMPALIPAAVCLIVGAHFFPLVQVFDQPQYRWTGITLCAVAVAGFVTAAIDGETSRAVVGLGAAITLWATSLHVARCG